ncbi:Hsp20/alpha crystallin family protein [Bacillus sp. ISL-51]|uniref:Hsp20/alpha crystallin family protein n=1 Tax=Bacteria TaxID=2 RepID=UPI001BEC5C58|nr:MULTISPECIES: Hsp20/alpha crystallin family protein [Bacteria]MBT2575165.1 Hsp20/alpha crystallin family protein [Bacillus sp. ISL-51]MBT2633461.1 Hsp20/alpha crystallin family protein [Bacillus sp. ISL-26]
MNHSKNDEEFDDMEEWLRQFYEDPYAWYDETLPIDLYETSQQYIIEADLTALQPIQMLTVTLSGCEFILSVKSAERTLKKQMMLPFYLNDKHIYTDFTNHILTVSMNKETNETPASFSFQFPL